MGLGINGRNARNVWRIAVEPHGAFVLADGTEVSHFAAWPRALVARMIRAGTSERGCCAGCGAPFVRVTSKPTGGTTGQSWHDHSRDIVTGNAKVGSSKGYISGATIAWHPSCICYGEPTPARVACPKCGGNGWETRYQVEDRSIAAGEMITHQPGRVSDPHIEPTGNPCPACLCPDCGGSGREMRYQTGEYSRKAGEMIHHQFGALSEGHKHPTGAPCPTCDGHGATGVTNGETWDAEVLAAWPRVPCTVLDPMAGSGTSGLAALDLNRSVILNDLHPDYVRLSKERLAAWPDKLPSQADEPVELEPLPIEILMEDKDDW